MISINKAIFLDRDGTINIDKDYIYKVSDFEFIDQAPEALKLLQDGGFQLIIITNQSGIARGYYTEEDYEKLNDWLLKTLTEQYGVNITASYFCPHHPEAVVEKYRKNCNCRKPKLGLFERAIAEHDIDLSSSYAIGDKLRDLAICERQAEIRLSDTHSGLTGLTGVAEAVDEVENRRAGQKRQNCQGFLIGSKESEEVIRSVKAGERQNIQYVPDLHTAAHRKNEVGFFFGKYYRIDCNG